MPEKEDEILRLAEARFKEGYDADEQERIDADRDIRFAINEENCQWDEAVMAIRRGDNPPRPCISINLIPEKIDQIEGEFRQSEISFKVNAVDSAGDRVVADILAGMLRFIEYDSKAKSNCYNTSHNSTLYGGRGGWRWVVVDDEDNPFVRSLKLKRITNIFSLVFDPFARELDRSDARYWFCQDLVPKEEYEAKYGKDSFSDWPDNGTWAGWRTEDARRVAEYWWKEEVSTTYYKVYRQGKMEVVTELMEFEEEVDQKTVKVPKIKWCVLTAGKILEGPHDWPSKYFPFVLQVGKEVMVGGKPRSRGMTRFAIESQQLYNFMVSQITEMFSLAPRSPYLAPADSIAPYKDIWDTANVKNYVYLPYKPDSSNPQLMPKREPPPTVDASMFNNLSVLEHNLMGAMGVYSAKLGDRGDEKSGKAIFARQAQGTQGAFVYSDNFGAALTHSCRIGIDLIPYIYDTERIVKIIGEDGQEQQIPVNTSRETAIGQQFAGMAQGEQVPLSQGPEYINQLNAGRYDVRVTVGPSYATQRQEALAQLVELARNNPQIAAVIPDLIAINLDIPKHGAELVRRLKAIVPQGIRGLEPGEQPQQPQPDPKLMIEMQKLQLDMRDMMRKEFDSHFKAMLMVAQSESLEAGQQVSQYEAIVDGYMRERELEAAKAEAAQQGQGNGGQQKLIRRQFGGPVPAGEPFLAGEAGPELLMPQGIVLGDQGPEVVISPIPGKIVPNGKIDPTSWIPENKYTGESPDKYPSIYTNKEAYVKVKHPVQGGLYPKGILQDIASIAKRNNIDPYDFMAMAIQETGPNKLQYATNPLMVISPEHQKAIAKRYGEDFINPEGTELGSQEYYATIDQAAKFVKENLRKYGDKTKAYQAYQGLGKTVYGGMMGQDKKYFGKHLKDIDFGKDMPHGKRILSIAESLKNNEEIIKLVNEAQKFEDKQGEPQ